MRGRDEPLGVVPSFRRSVSDHPQPGFRHRFPEADDTTQIVSVTDRKSVLESLRVQRDRCTFTVLAGPNPGCVYAVDKAGTQFGRGAEADARVEEASLSRLHARVFRYQGTYFIEDLRSTNGSWVNGLPVERLTELGEGDRLQLGKGVLLGVQLHDEFEQAAAKRVYESTITDPLTQVSNRRHLDDRLRGELAYSQRHGSPLSLLLLDIDHFKSVNDTFGHQAGDAVLRVLAGAMARLVRTEDLVARYGGEEFCIIARGIDEGSAFVFGERLRRMAEELSIPIDQRHLRITVSVGVVTNSRERCFGAVSELFAAVDAALYRAKDAGRNRICAA